MEASDEGGIAERSWDAAEDELPWNQHYNKLIQSRINEHIPQESESSARGRVRPLTAVQINYYVQHTTEGMSLLGWTSVTPF